MNPKWLVLAGELLKIASRDFANHGCNDFEWPKGWTKRQRRELVTAMWCDNLRKTAAELSADDLEEIEARVSGDYSPGDWWLMAFLGSQLAEDKS